MAIQNIFNKIIGMPKIRPCDYRRLFDKNQNKMLEKNQEDFFANNKKVTKTTLNNA